jgi:polysaccharide pyruvyl transferase WcaK-like protein
MSNSSALKIGLMGPFGGNLGDAAIQQAMLQNIYRFQPDAIVYGFSLYPDDTENRHGIPSFPINRTGDTERWWLGNQAHWFVRFLYYLLNRFKAVSNPYIRKFGFLLLAPLLEFSAILRAYQVIGKLDVLIVSGGGQLDDQWGKTWAHPYTLLMWAILAKLRQVKFAIVSVGAGPLNASLSKMFTRWTLSLATYRSYRDLDSKHYIEQVVGFEQPDLVYADLAYSLAPVEWSTTPTSEPAGLVVGIGPIPYCDPRIWPDRDLLVYQNYVKKLAEFAGWLLQKDYKLLFFVGEDNNDRPVIHDLKERLAYMKISCSEGQIIEEPILTVDDLLFQLSAVDSVITSRFHGLVFSQVLNKPVLALSYHPKMDTLMAAMGQAEYCLAIDRFNVEDLKQAFTQLESNQIQIQKRMSETTCHYQNILNQQYEYLFANR